MTTMEPAPSGATGEGTGTSTSEWPTRATDQVESAISLVRSKAVRPLQLIARAVVFGILAATMGTVLAVLAAVGTVRVLNVYAFPGREWASFAVVGGIFSLLGLFTWTLRRSRRKR
ncbi:MAG TPA: hypothetical protein VE152_10105 [Acidimicrobiales bacterium]|jgi:hypothetical protein|nr:hypothetical protein [Acidimicrobiales bacterium]